MDLAKVLTIALKDVRIRFSDRNLLLIMFAAPLAVTLIMGFAFSGFSNGDIGIKDVPIALVNEDAGASIFTQKLNYGDILTDILVPAQRDPNNRLHQIIQGQRLTRDEAIRMVNDGKLAIAVIIPPDFSESINPVKNAPDHTKIVIYRDSGYGFTANVVASIVRSIVNNLTSGNLAIFAAGQVNPVLKLQAQAIAEAMMQETTAPIGIKNTSIAANKQANSGSPLQYFAPSMAVFFLTFIMAGGASSILTEQNKWTLQRMLASPTSRATILGGKFLGIALTGLFQLLLLILLSSILGSIIFKLQQPLWGTNLPTLMLLVLATVGAATGLGLLIASIARSLTQVDVLSNAILMLGGILGGAFFDTTAVPFLNDAGKLTLNYWASRGFSTLARTNSMTEIMPNLLVLSIMFIVFFSIAVVLFNRRLNV